MSIPTDRSAARQASPPEALLHVCPECQGAGEVAGSVCLHCLSRGVVKRCPDCAGTGSVMEIDMAFRACCERCAGRAYIPIIQKDKR